MATESGSHGEFSYDRHPADAFVFPDDGPDVGDTDTVEIDPVDRGYLDPDKSEVLWSNNTTTVSVLNDLNGAHYQLVFDVGEDVSNEFVINWGTDEKVSVFHNGDLVLGS